MTHLTEYLHGACSFYFKFPVANKMVGVLFMKGHIVK